MSRLHLLGLPHVKFLRILLSGFQIEEKKGVKKDLSAKGLDR